MTNFQIYIFGYAILVIGLLAAGFLVGIPPTWLVVAAIVLIGIGIMSAVRKTKRREL